MKSRLIGLVIAMTVLAAGWARAQDRALHDDPWAYFDAMQLRESVPTPEQVIGHEIGERFTRHDQVARYARALADASPRVQFDRYGLTHERRDLLILTISSPDNLERLDEILARNAQLADPDRLEPSARDEIMATNPAIVWLSFNVHGNEASSSEAAMMVAYTLAAGRADAIDDILDRVVVVIDPMLNPDGHERYVSWYSSVAGRSPNEDHDAAEHHEPWPGGRTNHYLFDLNRDWVWLTQPESRQRLEIYRRYLPQLHIDYHEQGYRSPYFFGLGDDPYNTNIPQATRDWVGLYGDANAKVFDREGLVYSTKERFDYLYPGYGKVLPVYHGAVGMLCEQAGHGFAGLAVEISEHYTLTLKERARHHFLTAMSNIETTAQHRKGQLERFAEFFSGSIVRGREDPLTIFLSPDNDPHLLAIVSDLCDRQGIQIDKLTEAISAPELRSYRDGEIIEQRELPAGTWVIRTDQPMGRLARSLFERRTEVTDHDTYDITSWSVPVCFGIDALFTAERFVMADDLVIEPVVAFAPEGLVRGEGTVAILIDADQFVFPSVAGMAIENDLFVRFAGEDLILQGEHFGTGSLIVHELRNHRADLDTFVKAAVDAGARVFRASTGMTDTGPVLGANANRIASLPQIALVRGEPTSSYSFGQHWHLLDVAMPMPHTIIDADRLAALDLGSYNLIVLPDGARFGGAAQKHLDAWIRAGGTLVASGSAASWASTALLELDEPEDPEDLADRPDPNELSYKERADRRVEDRVPGATLRVIVDTTHPLAAGVPDWIGVLKRNDRRLPLGDRGSVIARYDQSPAIGGVISDRNQTRLAGTPFMTRHPLGSGSVICLADDVTVRGFLHGPMRLLLNAIIYGPSL